MCRYGPGCASGLSIAGAVAWRLDQVKRGPQSNLGDVNMETIVPHLGSDRLRSCSFRVANTPSPILSFSRMAIRVRLTPPTGQVMGPHGPANDLPDLRGVGLAPEALL